MAAPTTGRITLMVNGRNSDGTGHTDPVTGQFDGFRDELKTFDRMEETVESLGAGDSLFIANWQFVPTRFGADCRPIWVQDQDLGRPAGGQGERRRQDSGHNLPTSDLAPS